MKEESIRVLKVEPGKHPEEVILHNDLDSLQKAVSIGSQEQGLIEIIELKEGVCLLCNEEGKLIGLEGNRRVGNDIIAGVFYVTGEDEEGNLASLPEEEMLSYKEAFREIEKYTALEVESSAGCEIWPWEVYFR